MHIVIDGWDAGIKFSACHFIPGHDKCARLHGHIYAIHARVFGEQSESGMVWDFITLKNALRSLAEELDHRVLIPGECKDIEIDIGDDLKVKVGEKNYQFPLDDVVVMDIALASAEELAGFILKRLISLVEVPKNVNAIEIGIDEGKGQGAWVRKEF
ncbi:MAG: 6-carboxytetrahydropterin synthase [Thermoplasmata archaeon]|nr:MAG: 6-carboxytetrahydropterin synthase [Thermoplasmata archaeon]